MRVLLISHTCQSIAQGQPRAEYLAKFSNIELKVLIPDRWLHYGSWRSAQISDNTPYVCKAEKVAWPWVGPAQWYFHWYPGLKKILQEFKPDIIDIWEEPWSLVSAHTCWLKNRILPNTKVISESEQNISKSLPFPFESLRSYTLKNVNFAIGRSKGAVEVLRAKGYKGSAEVIPNGVDIQLFRPLERESCRRKLGIFGFTLGYVGRFVEEKGLMDIIDALSLCEENINFVFVGGGPFQKNLENKVKEIGKTKQVHFIPSQPLDKLPQIMNALDALVLVSHTTKRWKEQFGRVIIEANACQTPVIGSDSGAIPDTIGKEGLVVPEKNPKALAVAITQLHKNPDLRNELGLLGRKQAEEKYSWEQIALRLKNIYEQLIN